MSLRRVIISQGRSIQNGQVPFLCNIAASTFLRGEQGGRDSNRVACIHSSPVLLAGHNKWSKIKHQKGKNDGQKAVLFTKISVEIMEASRLAKGDTSDIRLAAAISRAKANNVPKDNVESAIRRGAEGKGNSNVEAVQYEGIGPGSVAIIVEALTDNRKRTAPNIRHHFSKNGGSLGTTGSVAWMFDRKGLLEVPVEGEQGGEELLEAALEAGAEDVEEDEVETSQGEGVEAGAKIKTARIYCQTVDLAEVRKSLVEKGYIPSLVEFTYLPKNWVDIDETEGGALATLLEALEDDADVQHVHINGRMMDDDEATAAA